MTTLTDLEAEVASGDRRRSLVALREFLAHELSGHRCKACQMSQLRTGDTAALVLRLTKVMEEIDALPPVGDNVSDLDRIRARRAAASAAAAPSVSAAAGMGSKNGPRRQGGRR